VLLTGSDGYRMVLRDVHLLAGRQPPLQADGRAIMALRHQGQIPPAERRSPPDQEHLELAELAHRTGEPIGLLARTDREYRREWLVRLRADDARQGREAMQHLRDLISNAERHRPGTQAG